MTLTELINNVYILTNRPDLVSQTFLAIQSATLKMHSSDYYYKDISEFPVQFNSSTYFQQIEYKTLIPRWRALKYIRKLDISTTPNTPGKFFDILTPDNILDSYSIQREDVCYVAGQILQIRSCTAIEYALMGAYIHPDIVQATYSSWIAMEFPFAIIFEAAATVFKMIGKKDEESSNRVLAGEQIIMLKMTNITADGE